MAKLIIQEKLILANPKVKDSQADKFRAMALPGAGEHYRSSVQYAYKNMDTRLYKSTKGAGFHDRVKASAKRHILDKFADHGITPNHAHIDRELDKAMAHWNKTQKGLKMKGVTESFGALHDTLIAHGYKQYGTHSDSAPGTSSARRMFRYKKDKHIVYLIKHPMTNEPDRVLGNFHGWEVDTADHNELGTHIRGEFKRK